MLAQIGLGNGQYCDSTARDSGSSDHTGRCFRQVTSPGAPGNQCCYDTATGPDNCTGTYDKVGTAGGANADGFCKFLLSNIPAHCDKDVIPWCNAHRDPATGKYCWSYAKTYDCNGNACPSTLPTGKKCQDWCGCDTGWQALRCLNISIASIGVQKAETSLSVQLAALTACEDIACQRQWVSLADGISVCMDPDRGCTYQTDGSCQ
jgi:hypothetical protein